MRGKFDGMERGRIILKELNVEELHSDGGPDGVRFVPADAGWVFLVVWVALGCRRYELLLQF